MATSGGSMEEILDSENANKTVNLESSSSSKPEGSSENAFQEYYTQV